MNEDIFKLNTELVNSVTNFVNTSFYLKGEKDIEKINGYTTRIHGFVYMKKNMRCVLDHFRNEAMPKFSPFFIGTGFTMNLLNCVAFAGGMLLRNPLLPEAGRDQQMFIHGEPGQGKTQMQRVFERFGGVYADVNGKFCNP